MTLTALKYIVAVLLGAEVRSSVDPKSLRSEAGETEQAGRSLIASQRGRFNPAPLAGIKLRTRLLATALAVRRNGVSG